MKEHIIANSFDIKLPGDMPGERGSGTFMLNDSCCFSSTSSSLHLSRSLVRDSGRKPSKLKEIVRPHCVNAFCSQTCELVISIYSMQAEQERTLTPFSLTKACLIGFLLKKLKLRQLIWVRPGAREGPRGPKMQKNASKTKQNCSVLQFFL